jgi:DNA repair protein RadA/Sms
LSKAKAPAMIVIDSVQTLWSEGLEAAPGTISQLRGCSALVSYARKRRTLVLVGHVTRTAR